MVKTFILSLAVAAPLALAGLVAVPSTAEAQWGPPYGGWDGPPPRHRGWDGPSRHGGWDGRPRWHRPPPPRCWMDRQRVWVDGPWGPHREWRTIRVCR